MSKNRGNLSKANPPLTIFQPHNNPFTDGPRLRRCSQWFPEVTLILFVLDRIRHDFVL